MLQFTDEQMDEARGMLIKAVITLTAQPLSTPNLAARNVIFHTEELMKALDAFYAGREPADERADE